MLAMSSSKPWLEASKALTGSRRTSAQSFLNYFEPLRGWLQEQIRNETLGWSETCPPFEPSKGGFSMKSVSQVLVRIAMVVSVVAHISRV